MANIIERFINIFVNTESANKNLDTTTKNLDKLGSSQTKITQTTKNFTKETHSSTEALVKNGGAMGLLNELTGGLAMTFKDASEAISLAGFSLNTLKGALISTGIGALVVALGYAVSHFQEISDLISGITAQNEKNSIAQGKANEEQRKGYQATNEQIAILQSNIDFENTKLIPNKERILKLEKEITKAKLEQLTLDAKTFKTESDIIKNKISGEQKELDKNINEAKKDLNRINYAIENNPIGSALMNAKKAKKDAEEDLAEARNQKQLFESTNKDFLRLKELETKQSDIALAKHKLLSDDIVKQKTLVKELGLEKAKADAKANSDSDRLKKEEEGRLERLKQIRNAITAQVEAEEKVFNRSEIEKVALALNKQYSEIVKIYDIRNKLIQQQKEAEKLADESGGKRTEAEEAQLSAIVKQIEAYDLLIAKKKEVILQDSELDKFAQTRLDLIEMNLDAELEMIIGNTIDASKIRIDALKTENEMKAQIRAEELEKEKAQVLEAEKVLASITDVNSEEYANALAVKNDLTKQYNDDVVADAEATSEESSNIQVAEFERYITLKDEQKRLDDEYYENLSAVSSQFQGFLSQLQDRELIKSKEIRKLLLVAEKGLAVAGVITSTIRQNNELKATAISEGIKAAASTASYDFVGAAAHTAAATAASAGIGLNTVSAGISIASILATTASGLSSISNEGGGTQGGGTGGSISPQAQFNIVGQNQQNQLASQIGKSQQQPVEAFVVGKTVTNQQELDRAINRTATFL